MKGFKVALLTATTLLLGTEYIVFASPQATLDPYAYIQAPPTTGQAAQDLRVIRKQARKKKAIKMPPSVLKPATAPPAYTTAEQRKPKPAAPSVSAPATPATPAISAGAGATEAQPGVISGTKQIFQGIGTATKGAASNIFTPLKKLGTGTVAGAKNSGSYIGKGALSLGGGFKSAGGKMKDGTASVGGKVKDGSAAAGHAVLAFPKMIGKTLHLTGGEKIAADQKPVEKVQTAEKPQPPAAKPVTASQPEKAFDNIADTPAPTTATNADQPALRPEAKLAETPIKTAKEEEKASLAGKVLGAPKTLGKGVMHAASKTGETTKKFAVAPFKGLGKINPFKHDDKPQTATSGDKAQTAAKEPASQTK